MSNTVKFGIKNVYYAVCTLASNGSGTYGTPVALKGAVSLSLEAQGDITTFYADDVAYYTSNANAGYQGDLELALIPDSFKKDVLGFAEDANGVLYENADAPIVYFALMFEFDGDVNKKRHVMYKCTSSRPAVASTTETNTKEPQTETITITSTPIYNASLSKYIPKASATPTQSCYATWNSTVYQPVATAVTNTETT